MMNHHPVRLTPEYSANEYAVLALSDYGSEYLHSETSAQSSPSPVMWALPDQYVPQLEHISYETGYEHPNGYQYFDSMRAAPTVEFTDLTAPYQEDRRRRRTPAKDQQEISTMHLRRRAQNRASQRAFRERKEKHAQDLQNQLDELDAKYKSLQESYEELGNTNKKLAEQLSQIRDRRLSVQTHRDNLKGSLVTEELGLAGDGEETAKPL